MHSDPCIEVAHEIVGGLGDTSVSLTLDPAYRCPVLIVDDDKSIVAALATLMRRANYEVYTADSARQALCVMNTVACSVVITDWQMPDMDGLALCRNLRSRENGPYVYILLFSVRNNKSDILAGLAAGADDYVAKDAKSEEILARVEVGRRITRLDHSLRISNRENRRLSVTDPLTGAYNRRFLMRYLPREFERSRRLGHPLAVLSCDIDRFKQINDQFGHEAGDQVLQEFARRVGTCIRDSTDWIARTGGEEFIIVLPETNLQGATRVAEKVRMAIADRPFVIEATTHPVTVSIGATALEAQTDFEAVSLNELLRTADRCLYMSKNLGRDRATAKAPLPA